MSTTLPRVLTFSVVAAAVLLAGVGAPAQAQTIRGTLMEVQSDRPISLGLVIMMTEAGDSVTSAVTNSQGRFEVRVKEPGSYAIRARAPGYAEATTARLDVGEDPRLDLGTIRLDRGGKLTGIVLDAMDTGAACRTYNVLMAEDRRVAAALIAIS